MNNTIQKDLSQVEYVTHLGISIPKKIYELYSHKPEYAIVLAVIYQKHLSHQELICQKIKEYKEERASILKRLKRLEEIEIEKKEEFQQIFGAYADPFFWTRNDLDFQLDHIMNQDPDWYWINKYGIHSGKFIYSKKEIHESTNVSRSKVSLIVDEFKKDGVISIGRTGAGMVYRFDPDFLKMIEGG